MSSAPNRALASITTISWLIALAALGALLAFFVLRAVWVVPFPFAVENAEGYVLAWTALLQNGQLPYGEIAEFPWDFAGYTPGYFVATAALSALLPDPPWLAGRLLSLGSALLAAGLLARQMPVGGRWLRWLPAALWLASPYLFRWSTFFRPDLFALAWSMAGLVLTLEATRRNRPRWLIAAALCFVVGFWSKQSFFPAPLAATLWMAWHHRRWLPWLLGPGIMGGVLIALLLWAEVGSALYQNLIQAHATAFSWEALWHFESSFVRTAPALVILGLLALFQPRPRAQPGTTLFGITLLISWLVTISAGKVGAWENYFLEVLWLLCALAGRAALALQARGGWASALLPLLVILQVAAFLPAYERHSPATERAWLDELFAAQSQLHEMIAPLPQEAVIWSEDVALLADSGRPVYLVPFAYAQLDIHGLWDSTPLTTRLATGADPLLVQRWDAVSDPLGRGRWSRSMLDASERGYALGTRVERWRVRPPLPFPAADEPRPLGEGVELLTWMALPVTESCQWQSRDLCLGEPLVGPVALSPSPLAAHLLFRSAEPLPPGLVLSAQLFDPSGERVAQEDLPLRVDSLGGAWPAGALLRDERLLTLPDELPPGDYALLLTIYHPESGETIGSTTLDRFGRVE